MIICEIGINHLGDEDYADEYISALIEARADAVTFQVREPEFYQGENVKLLLRKAYYENTLKRVKQAGLRFGMALADENQINFFEKLDTDFYKILSKDFFNPALTQRVLATKKTVWFSTGMSDLEEVNTFSRSLSGEQKKRARLIHTQLTYDPNEAQLKAIPLMRKLTGLPVAFGSHAKNATALYAAVSFEPSDIFFYVRGDRKQKHPDHGHAVPLANVSEVITNLRELSVMLGTGEKRKMENNITT